MNRILNFSCILCMAFVWMVSGCYEDKGNYTYKELPALAIDTVNSGIKAEMTAVQLENFRMPVKVNYAGDKSNLAYEWKLYPQNPQKPDEAVNFDSAVILSAQEVLDTVMNVVPGKYYLVYTVTERVCGVKEYLKVKLTVESALSRGLCVLDEKGGNYDLHLIKSARLLTDISAADEKVYYNVFTSVNGRTETEGRFLGQYQNTLYFFTAKGAYLLNSNSFGIESEDYRGLFSFPMSIQPDPQGFMVSSRPVEFIVNDGLIYAFDHMTWGQETFGDRLDGDYYAAPYLPNLSTSAFATVIYDVKNGRFAPVNAFGKEVGAFEDNYGMEFNLNDIGKNMEIKYMDNGFNACTYTVFKNREDSGYFMYVTDFSGEKEMPVEKYDMSGCPDLNDRSLYAFGNRGNVCFYTSGSTLYQYRYASGNTGAAVHDFGGETISSMKIFRRDGHVRDGELLMLSTCRVGGEGRVYLIGFNGLNGTLDVVNAEMYEGFGKIVDMYYKE